MKHEEPRFDRMFSLRLLVGLWIIALGAIFLAGNLGWINARSVLRHFWPLIFILIGTGMLAQPHNPRRRRWAWIFIGLGVWQFADKIGWIGLSFWELLFPVALLSLGGMLVWRALAGPRNNLDVPEVMDEHSEFVRTFAVMSGTELRTVSRPFRGADLSAVTAGIKLDLSDARMEGDVATIEVFAFWGGIEIYVPKEWTVTSRVNTFMGGFIDKRRPTTIVPTKTLVITGLVIMSGVEVKN